MPTVLSATSEFERGDEVRLDENIKWGEFRVVGLKALTKEGQAILTLKAQLECPDGTVLEATITGKNLTDKYLKHVKHIETLKHITSQDLA